MARQNILVADNSEEFREAICAFLERDFVVTACDNGSTALELLQAAPPDGLVLDLMLPGTDGISLLRRLRQAYPEDRPWPVILALTRFVSPYVYAASEELDIRYMMLKPCSAETVADHMVSLCKKPEVPEEPLDNPRITVSNLLRTVGIPAKRAGYGFLREAILLKMQDPRQSMMKEIYPAVGKSGNATVNQVERNIRSAIEAAWLNHESPLWQELFPEYRLTRPTNAEFIARLADYLADTPGILQDMCFIG